MKSAVLAVMVPTVLGHGHMVMPASRNGGNVTLGGGCTNGACYWFTNNIEIMGKVTLPDQYRTLNRDAAAGSEADVYKTSPWRAPGTAKVYGSGCGVAGGSDTIYANGGSGPWVKDPSLPIYQGMDGTLLPPGAPTKWTRGSAASVGFAISANHGGGYSYRLCSKSQSASEECFQNNQLRFAGDSSWILYTNGTMSEPFKRITVTEGTYPSGSEWAFGPVPGCLTCDPYSKCGYWTEPPIPGFPKSNPWDDWVNCNGICDGAASSKHGGVCPDGTAHYPEPVPGISGFGKYNWDWSVVDKVQVPADLDAGEYLLSWRWDCEESTQVWENCADITLV